MLFASRVQTRWTQFNRWTFWASMVSSRMCRAVHTVAFVGLLPGFVHAQMPRPRLNVVDPIAVSVNSTTILTVTGSDLDDPVGLRFSDAGLTAEPVSGKALSFKLAVPTNLPAGVREVRFMGRFGVSNPRLLWFGAGKEISQSPTNDTRETAAPLDLQTGVNGRVESGKSAWFRFSSPRQAAFEIQVAGIELDTRLEPDLALYDVAGKELARSRKGGRLVWLAAQTGDFTLALNDLRFRGGEGFGYRLVIIPSNPNTDTNLNQAGFLVPPRRSLSQGGQNESGPAAPVLFAPTNGLLSFIPPGIVRGRFPRRGEVAGVTFAAKKGDLWWLELTSDRFGFPTDPLVLVQRIHPKPAEGKAEPATDVVELSKLDANIGGNEYPTGSRDVAGRFEAPEDGLYRVLIRDLFAQSPRALPYEWRLQVRPETPGFSLVVVPTPLPRQKDDDRQITAVATNLRRDETMSVKVLAFRHDGFQGDIELTATNLPAGVAAHPGRIISGQRVGALLLTASIDATNSVSVPIIVRGWAQVGTNRLTAEAHAGTSMWSAADWDLERPPARLAAEFALGIIGAEAAPISLWPTTNFFEVNQGQKLPLPLHIERRGEFTAAFNLKPFGHPAFEKAKDLLIPEKATNASVELNLADYPLPVGTHLLWLEGRAPGKYRNQLEAVEVAKSVLKSAEEALAQVKSDAKEAAEKKKKDAADQLKNAEERAKPRDVFAGVSSHPFTVRVLSAPESKAAVNK